RYDESKDFVRKAVALDPDYKEGVLFLIELFKEEEKFADIIDLINEIQQSGAQDPLYEWELARAHREIESYADALKHYREAYNTLNKDSDFLKEYAYFLVEEGRMDAAIQCLNLICSSNHLIPKQKNIWLVSNNSKMMNKSF